MSEKYNRILLIIVALITVPLTLVTLFKLNSISSGEGFVLSREDADNKSPLKAEIKGAVNNAGVYELQSGQTVNDLILLAGGFSQNADLERIESTINKAEQVYNGSSIVIPELTIANTSDLTGDIADIGIVDINTASQAEIEDLPGIGPSIALKIIEGRPYGSIEDIKNVKGVGDALYEKIKDKISAH